MNTRMTSDENGYIHDNSIKSLMHINRKPDQLSKESGRHGCVFSLCPSFLLVYACAADAGCFPVYPVEHFPVRVERVNQ